MILSLPLSSPSDNLDEAREYGFCLDLKGWRSSLSHDDMQVSQPRRLTLLIFGTWHGSHARTIQPFPHTIFDWQPCSTSHTHARITTDSRSLARSLTRYPYALTRHSRTTHPHARARADGTAHPRKSTKRSTWVCASHSRLIRMLVYVCTTVSFANGLAC